MTNSNHYENALTMLDRAVDANSESEAALLLQRARVHAMLAQMAVLHRIADTLEGRE